MKNTLIILCLILFSSCSNIKLSQHEKNGANTDIQKLHQSRAHLQWAYFGAAISEFSWKYDTLTSWQNSNRTLETASLNWLSMPTNRRRSLHNPSFSKFNDQLKQFTSNLSPDINLILFLGTHHLDDGQLLFNGDEKVSPEKLLQALKHVPQKTILLLDVCYAERFQKLDWPQNIKPIYSSLEDETTPEVHLQGHSLKAKEFFLRHHYILKESLQRPEKKYSYLGLLFSNSLRRLLLQDRKLSYDNFYYDMKIEEKKLHKTARTLRLPSLAQ